MESRTLLLLSREPVIKLSVSWDRIVISIAISNLACLRERMTSTVDGVLVAGAGYRQPECKVRENRAFTARFGLPAPGQQPAA